MADDETHAFFTRLMDESGAMLWGRVTYEMMESYWPAVACGDSEALLRARHHIEEIGNLENFLPALFSEENGRSTGIVGSAAFSGQDR